MNLARLLLVVLPCVPGLIFLAVGFLRDPHKSVQGPASATPSEDDRATVQAHALYRAGAITLLGGTLGMMAVGWKIARTRPEEANTAFDTDGESSR